MAVGLGSMAQLSDIRTDVTSEGLSQLTPGTIELIEGIGADRPVTVHAFISADIPRGYVTGRSRLMNILREMKARGGPGLEVRIVEPKPYSDEAEEAMDKYGIYPRDLAEREGGRVEVKPVFLGLAFVSGANEEIVPFLSRGLSAEYEVARALRVVTQDKKKVLGILRTDAPLMGSFDLQSKSQTPAWQIIEELRKQYEVRSINPTADIRPPECDDPDKPKQDCVDVLIVPQLPSLTQPELDKVQAYIDAGHPALLTADPFPTFNIRLAPPEDKPPPPGQNPMGGGPPSTPKGDWQALLRSVGAELAFDTVMDPEALDAPPREELRIIYDTFKPHPRFASIAPQVVFVTERDDGTKPFENVDPAVNGLEEVVVLFAGELRKASGFTGNFTPLLQTGRSAGYALYDDMVDRHPFFGTTPRRGGPEKQSPVTGQTHVFAARISGGGGGAPLVEGQAPPADRNVVVIADLDLIHDQFFALRDEGGDTDGDGLVDIRFDNVTFLLNIVDSLAGDDRFVELRKRMPQYRRLTWIDEQTKLARDTLEGERQKALDAAKAEIEAAQAALDAKVQAIEARTDLDDRSKEVQARAAELAENRRLEASRIEIERTKEKVINKIEREHEREVDEVRNQVRILAVVLPPVPALLLGFFIFWRKRKREQETIPAYRRAKS
jgi:ABC-2 type transport system permease protein